jgi:hypothetical protein
MSKIRIMFTATHNRQKHVGTMNIELWPRQIRKGNKGMEMNVPTDIGYNKYKVV